MFHPVRIRAIESAVRVSADKGNTDIVEHRREVRVVHGLETVVCPNRRGFRVLFCFVQGSMVRIGVFDSFTKYMRSLRLLMQQARGRRHFDSNEASTGNGVDLMARKVWMMAHHFIKEITERHIAALGIIA